MSSPLDAEGYPPGLLVSVRSAEEARAAVEGGASVVDVKEPDRGPLGRAPVETWRAVRAAVPISTPVSVALGELREFDPGRAWDEDAPAGIAFCKLGLAGAGEDWRADWDRARRLQRGETRWVAVIYADWSLANSPHPADVIEAAVGAPDCAGVLVDTWDKTKPNPLGVTRDWNNWIRYVKISGRFVILAGRLDSERISQLAPLRPDLYAVRGAACVESDRKGVVCRDRVAGLVRAISATRRGALEVDDL